MIHNKEHPTAEIMGEEFIWHIPRITIMAIGKFNNEWFIGMSYNLHLKRSKELIDIQDWMKWSDFISMLESNTIRGIKR